LEDSIRKEFQQKAAEQAKDLAAKNDELINIHKRLLCVRFY
jgi:hypothetical protein